MEPSSPPESSCTTILGTWTNTKHVVITSGITSDTLKKIKASEEIDIYKNSQLKVTYEEMCTITEGHVLKSYDNYGWF